MARSVVVVTLAAGCAKASGGAPGEPSPLLEDTTRKPRAIDVERAATHAEEAVRALGSRHSDTAAALGPHRLEATSSVRVAGAEGGELEALDEQALVEVAKDAWHVRYGNSREYAREAWFAGGTLWLRPGHGKYHRRAPVEPEEPARIVDETWGTLGAHAELVAHAIAVADGGSVSVGGRTARRITLSLAPAPRPRARATLPQQAWRDSIVVTRVEGEATLDAETGALLAGRLEATLRYARDGQRYEMRLSARHTVTVGAVTISPPAAEESMDTPRRTRDVEDRAELLDGLAPPPARR